MTPALDRSRRPAPAPERPLVLPGFQRPRLASGLGLWLAERPALPEVSLRLILEAGAAAEPPEQAGVAALTARLLTEGAGPRDATGVAEWLDRLGASFRASAHYDVLILSMHFLSDVTEGALDFLASVVREPRFEPSEVERVRGERLDEIQREHDEPAFVADRALIEAIYADAPYGRPSAGTADTVAGIGPSEVRAFHEGRFGARDGLFVAAGDFAAAELAEQLAQRFGDWGEAAGRPEPPATPNGPATRGEVLLIDRPGSPQAEVRVGTVGAPHRTPDLFGIMVANAILGGLFNSRINMNLREDKGWTYGARTAFRLRRGAGPFVARTAVETAVTAGAFGEILAEIEGLDGRPPEADEMRLARNALTLSLPLQFETSGQVCQRVARRLIYQLPEDYWETYRARIEAVTPDEVVEVRRRYLTPERLVLVAVADADAVQADLERLGPVQRLAAPAASGT